MSEERQAKPARAGISKATVARRSYNRALKDLERDLDIAREAARQAVSVVKEANNPAFLAWLRGLDFAEERARRLRKVVNS